jgi:hypothetical protein
LPLAPPFVRPERDASGRYWTHYYRAAGCTILRFAYVGDFYLWPDRIVCYLLDPEYRLDLVDSCFLGPVLALRLEMSGIPTLHASAVVDNGRALAFLSPSGRGKSTLAATMILGGALLLTDDVLAVEPDGKDGYIGRPGYPDMRFWPEEACFFLGEAEPLARVTPFTVKRRAAVELNQFGRFAPSAYPLALILVPERTTETAGAHIVPMSQAEAVVELSRYSFFPDAVRLMGLTPRRLDFFCDLVRQVRFGRLIYPHGLEHLDQVRAVVAGYLRG